MKNIHLIILGVIVGTVATIILSNLDFFLESAKSNNLLSAAISHLHSLKPPQVVRWIGSLLVINFSIVGLLVGFILWILTLQRSIRHQDDAMYELHLQVAELMKTKKSEK